MPAIPFRAIPFPHRLVRIRKKAVSSLAQYCWSPLSMKKLDAHHPEIAPLTSGFVRGALPGDLVRALEWLRIHFSEPIDLELLASVAGMRPRTLENHFKRFLGTSPLGFVRQMRLASARRELEIARDDASVTRIAFANGFRQLGRFAAEYHSIFGETPSATLRRSRSSSRMSGEPVDDEAVRLTWQAIPYVFAIAPHECAEAIETLERAREMAPSYGLPVALSAWCWSQRAAHGFSAMPKKDRETALQLAARTPGLAGNDALALTLASGALTLAHHLEEADRLLERALACDPWLPYAWVRRGWASAYTGDPQAAVGELRIALQLAPVGPMRHIAMIGMGCARFAFEHYGAAAKWVQSGADGFPGAIWADRITVAAAAQAGARAEARRIARRLMRKDPDLTVELAKKAWPFPPAFMSRLGEGLEIAGIPRH